MKQNDELFELIKSLSKSEKRYFKIYATRHTIGEKNKYVELFDRLDRMKEFNVTTLDKHYGAKNYSRTKWYLFDAIMESLETFQGDKNVGMKVSKMVRQGEMLFKRGLYHHSEKILSKAKRLAKETQNYPKLFSILMIERQLLVNMKLRNITKNELEAKTNESLSILDKIREEILIRKTHERLLIHFNKYGTLRNNSQKAELDEIAANPEIESAVQSDSLKTRMFGLNIKNQIAWFNKDFQKSLDHCKEIYELTTTDQSIKIQGQRAWLSAANNYLTRCAFVENFEELKRVLEEVSDVQTEDEDMAILKFRIYYTFRLQWCNQTANFEDGDLLIRKLEKGLLKYKGKFNRDFELNLYCIVSVFYFLQNQFDEALDWINKFVNVPGSSQLFKNVGTAEIYRLIIFYEKSEFDLLDYQIQQAKSVLKKFDHFPKFYDTMIKGLSDLLKAVGKNQTTAVFKLLTNSLNQLRNSTEEEPAFGIFDFERWAKSKAINESIVTIIRGDN